MVGAEGDVLVHVKAVVQDRAVEVVIHHVKDVQEDVARYVVQAAPVVVLVVVLVDAQVVVQVVVQVVAQVVVQVVVLVVAPVVVVVVVLVVAPVVVQLRALAGTIMDNHTSMKTCQK